MGETYSCALIGDFDEDGRPLSTSKVDVPADFLDVAASRLLQIAAQFGFALEVSR